MSRFGSTPPGRDATVTDGDIADLITAQSLSAGTASGTQGLALAGIFSGDGTHGGPVTLQWAQNTTTASNTLLLANSFLICTRLA